jgi:GYD domain
MKRTISSALTTLALLVTGLAMVSSDAIAQQTAPSRHRYFFKAVYTAEGMKDLRMRGATALGENVAKFDASVGCRLEVWYFDYTESANYGFVDCPSEIAMATIAATANAAGFVHLTMTPVLTPREMDEALAKSQSIRPPQQQ